MIVRFLWHYIEMVIAMSLGMLLLGLVWQALLPEITRIDVQALLMAADMSIGMAVWMRIRRHGWSTITEMSAAMFAPFLIVLVPYWLGLLPEHHVMLNAHVLMFVLMGLVLVRRRREYTLPRYQHGILPGELESGRNLGHFGATGAPAR